MQLTEAEASFRALKSELRIRPLFHQLEPRVKAHVMGAFLGYTLWVTLKHLLKRARRHRRASIGQRRLRPGAVVDDEGAHSTLLVAIRRHCPTHHRWSRDAFAPYHRTYDGTEILLLQRLGISLPERFAVNRKCSVDSAPV
jgi:hypothetical protein